MSLPQTHVEDSIKLTSDGMVELYVVTLRNESVLYLKNDQVVTWNGNTYETSSIKLTGLNRNATGEASRPTVSIVNPAGVYSALVAQGLLEKGRITQYRVLYQHVVANLPIAQTRTWVINRVANCDYEQISVELRDQTDAPNFTVPARMYLPPEFPMVSLQ